MIKPKPLRRLNFAKKLYENNDYSMNYTPNNMIAIVCKKCAVSLKFENVSQAEKFLYSKCNKCTPKPKLK